jgi:hypothetical protein
MLKLHTFSLYAHVLRFIESPIPSLLTYMLVSHYSWSDLQAWSYPRAAFLRSVFSTRTSLCAHALCLFNIGTALRKAMTIGHCKCVSLVWEVCFSWCRFGCRCLEMPHYLLVECHRFAEMRNKLSQTVFDLTSVFLWRDEYNYSNNGGLSALRMALFRRWCFSLAQARILMLPLNCTCNQPARTDVTCISDEDEAYCGYLPGRV